MRSVFGSRWFWAAVAVAILAAGTCGFALRGRILSRKPPEKTVRIERGVLEVRYTEAGEVVPVIKVPVRSPVQGTVSRLAAEEGQRVVADQLLAVILPGRSKAEKFLPVEIRSPLEATVLERFVQEGEAVADNGEQSRLFELTDMGRMEILLKINEIDILKLRRGMAATITLDALPDETFAGKIRFLSPGVKGQKQGQSWEDSQRGVKTFDVRLELARADPRLRPGMTVRVDLLLDRKENVLKAPLSAVEEHDSKAQVYLPGRPPKPKPVRLGLKNEMEAEVLAGLGEGTEILLQKPEEASGTQGAGRPAASGSSRGGFASGGSRVVRVKR